MILSPQQIQELLDILAQQQIMFVGNNLGSDVLTEHDKRVLRNVGIDVASLPKQGMIDDAFHWGMLSDAIGHQNAKNMTYGEFKKFVQSKQWIPLTTREKFMKDLYKQRAYSDSMNLLDRMQKDMKNAIYASSQNTIGDPKEFEKLLRKEGAKSIVDRKSVKQLSSELRSKSKDWSRDMDRIADYVSHTAFDMGRAMNIVKNYGEDARVYKTVYPGGCKHCIRLYLTKGMGSTPKVFKVSELIANGSNIGRKAKDWKAVIGATHPWCRCTLHRYEEGSIFDEKEGMFKLQPNQRKVERKSKIKITIGGKTKEV